MSASGQLVVLASRKVRTAIDSLLDPDAKDWSRSEGADVDLVPTPLEKQPAAYVRAAWAQKPRGGASTLGVRTLTNSKVLAIRMEWECARPQRGVTDYNQFPDACAILFPADGKTLEHDTMGSPAHPVEAWHWRAGTDEPFVVEATGIGTTQRQEDHSVVVSAEWVDGRWRVVFARPLDADGVKLKQGAKIPIAFAVWSGVLSERAGLKSYSAQPLKISVGE